MTAVFISTDRSILTGENGDAYRRHRLYAKYFDKLYVIIFSRRRDDLRKIEEGNLIFIPTNSSSRWWFVLDSLRILTTIPRVDIISTQDPFVAGLVGVVAKFLWGIKLNIQVHIDFFVEPYFRRESFQNYFYYWLGKFSLRYTDSIRVVSPRLRCFPKAFVAPIATDLKSFWTKPHAKRYGQVVTVARLAKQKNLPLFFEVAKRLKKRYPRLRFVVVGEGEERRNLENLLKQMALDNVTLLGQKSHEELKDILARSDVFVLTSDYEGWGVATVEAIATGLPVVMTDTGCAGSVVINDQTGVVAKPGDLRGLVEGISKLLDDWPVTSRKYVVAGQKLLRSTFARDKLTEDFIQGLKQT